jgi:hypothetical protein
MTWEVEVSDEFAEWFRELTVPEKVKITASVTLLEEDGPNLDHPHSSRVKGSRFGNSRFYEQMIPQADSIFEQHLREI